MSLESTLAQIQVRAKEISERSCTGHKQGIDVNWSRISNYTDGITHEATIVYDSYRAGKGAKSPSEANRHLGEFATGLKNMADNLNGLLQTLYTPSVKSVSHKEIVKIDGKSPALDNGTSMLDLFLQTHDHANGDVVRMRNRRSHGSGHDLVHICNDGLKVISGQTVFSVEEWMEDRAKSYFGMTSKILDTLAEKEQAKLSDRTEYSGPGLFGQMFRNWRLRHQKPIALAAGGAILASGILGTLFVKDNMEKQRRIYEGSQVMDMVLAAQTANTDLWAYEIATQKFGAVLNDISKRNTNLGVDVDNYVMTLRAISNNHLTNNVERSYSDFTYRRSRFKQDLNEAKSQAKTVTMRDQVDMLYKISTLLIEERLLAEESDKMHEKLGWSRPLNSSFYVDSPESVTSK